MKYIRMLWFLLVAPTVLQSASAWPGSSTLGDDVEQIEVLNQTSANVIETGDIPGCQDLTWEKIADQEGGNCGYHALYNIMTFIKLWQAQDQSTAMYMSKEKYTEFLQKAVPQICWSDRTTWLDGQQIETIYKDVAPAMGIDVTKFPFILIEYIPSEHVSVTEDVLKVIQHFVQVQDGAVAFIWNVGARMSLQQAGGAHWVASIAVRQDGELYFYYMNSFRGLLDNQFHLVKSLFAKTPQELQKMIDDLNETKMQANVDNIKSKIQVFKNPDQNDVYQYFRGCLEFDGPYITQFTLKQLQTIIPDAPQAALDSVNAKWRAYNQGKNIAAMPSRKRFYCVWSNAWEEVVVYNVDKVDQHRWLQVKDGGKTISLLDPTETFYIIIKDTQQTWKDIPQWPVKIQQEVADLLFEIFDIELSGVAEVIGHSAADLKNNVSKILKKLTAIDEATKNRLQKVVEHVVTYLGLPEDVRKDVNAEYKSSKGAKGVEPKKQSSWSTIVDTFVSPKKAFTQSLPKDLPCLHKEDKFDFSNQPINVFNVDVPKLIPTNAWQSSYQTIKNILYVLQCLKDPKNFTPSYLCENIVNAALFNRVFEKSWLPFVSTLSEYQEGRGLDFVQIRELLGAIAGKKVSCWTKVDCTLAHNIVPAQFTSGDVTLMEPSMLDAISQGLWHVRQGKDVGFVVQCGESEEYVYSGVVLHPTQTGVVAYMVNSFEQTNHPTLQKQVSRLLTWNEMFGGMNVAAAVAWLVDIGLPHDINQIKGASMLSDMQGNLMKMYHYIQRLVLYQNIFGFNAQTLEQDTINKSRYVMYAPHKAALYDRVYRLLHDYYQQFFIRHNDPILISNVRIMSLETDGVLPNATEKYPAMLEQWAQHLGLSLRPGAKEVHDLALD